MTDLTSITRPTNGSWTPTGLSPSEIQEEVNEQTKFSCASALDQELTDYFMRTDSNTDTEYLAKAAKDWSKAEKQMVVIHMRFLGTDFELGVDHPSRLGITLGVDGYSGAPDDSQALAEHLVNSGFFEGLSDETPDEFLNWCALKETVELVFETADIAGECVIFRFCDQTWADNRKIARSL